MEVQRKFTLCVGEMWGREEDENGRIIDAWYHSHLCLKDVTKGDLGLSSVHEYIHLNPKDGFMVAKIRAPYRGLDEKLIKREEIFYRNTEFFPILSGYADQNGQLPIWEHASDNVSKIPKKTIRFGCKHRHSEEVINCRTGVRETLKMLGLQLFTQYTRSAAGMKASPFYIGPKYNHGPYDHLLNLTKN